MPKNHRVCGRSRCSDICKVRMWRPGSFADNTEHDMCRFTACPAMALFDGGLKYMCNSTLVENQTEPYTASMATLPTRFRIRLAWELNSVHCLSGKWPRDGHPSRYGVHSLG
jgi:hypothetical protein